MFHKDFKLTDSELWEIAAKFPPDVIALCSKYPIDILNASDSFDNPPLQHNYIPKLIEIYYEQTLSPQVFIMDGILEDYHLLLSERQKDYNSISVMIDHDWAYIEVEGKILLNRLGGVILPDVIIEPAKLISSVLSRQIHD